MKLESKFFLMIRKEITMILTCKENGYNKKTKKIIRNRCKWKRPMVQEHWNDTNVLQEVISKVITFHPFKYSILILTDSFSICFHQA